MWIQSALCPHLTETRRHGDAGTRGKVTGEVFAAPCHRVTPVAASALRHRYYLDRDQQVFER